MWYTVLPYLNALLNTTSALLLVTGYVMVRRGNIALHLTCMISALVSSTLFLISYLTYHYYHGTTRFAGEGLVRPLYFTILGTHTVLAVVILPFIFVTVYRAATSQFQKHKRVARWTFPLWLYVSVTGVVVYLMLYRMYPAR
jgi:putative membrane protein